MIEQGGNTQNPTFFCSKKREIHNTKGTQSLHGIKTAID